MVHEEKTLVEKVTAKHTIDMLIVRDPKGETEQSLKVNDYFRATTYLHAVLEYRGKLAIERKLKSEGRNVNSDLIDDLTLKEVAMMTYSMKLVEQPCYSAMIGLNKLRNSLVHFANFEEFYKAQGNEAKTTITNAMKCLNAMPA